MGLKNNAFMRGCYFLYKSFFCSRLRHGGGVINPPHYIANPANLFIGKDVGIGSYFYATGNNATITIKDHCAIAEHVTIHTGNHARIVGMWITDINETNKPEGYDHPVSICEDVWIGCNVTILSGVTIGRGSTIAAGAVVNRDVPPYSIVGGVPAHFIQFIWSIDEIMKHEKTLYPENERYTKEQLEQIFEKNTNKD